MGFLCGEGILSTLCNILETSGHWLEGERERKREIERQRQAGNRDRQRRTGSQIGRSITIYLVDNCRKPVRDRGASMPRRDDGVRCWRAEVDVGARRPQAAHRPPGKPEHRDQVLGLGAGGEYVHVGLGEAALPKIGRSVPQCAPYCLVVMGGWMIAMIIVAAV